MMITWWTRSRRSSGRGSVTLEAAIILPLVALIILFVVAAGRLTLAQSAVTSAAAAAARAASLERAPGAASQAAVEVTQATLNQKGLSCMPQVSTDVSGFNTEIGSTATVETTVTCAVPLADLTFPGLPGSRTITKSASSILDAYRER